LRRFEEHNGQNTEAFAVDLSLPALEHANWKQQEFHGKSQWMVIPSASSDLGNNRELLLRSLGKESHSSVLVPGMTLGVGVIISTGQRNRAVHTSAQGSAEIIDRR
jgi:hypothetical protein